MRIGRANNNIDVPKLEIRINNVLLDEVTEYKYLGAIIDSNFTFKPHATKVVRTLSHKVYMFGRIRKHLDEEKAILLYKQMVTPYADCRFSD